MTYPVARVLPCPDCSGLPPAAITAPAGFDSAVLFVHDGSCPLALAGLYRAEGPA